MVPVGSADDNNNLLNNSATAGHTLTWLSLSCTTRKASAGSKSRIGATQSSSAQSSPREQRMERTVALLNMSADVQRLSQQKPRKVEPSSGRE